MPSHQQVIEPNNNPFNTFLSPDQKQFATYKSVITNTKIQHKLCFPNANVNNNCMGEITTFDLDGELKKLPTTMYFHDNIFRFLQQYYFFQASRNF